MSQTAFEESTVGLAQNDEVELLLIVLLTTSLSAERKDYDIPALSKLCSMMRHAASLGAWLPRLALSKTDINRTRFQTVLDQTVGHD